MPERRGIEKVEKRLVNLHDKKEYAIHIRSLKQLLNHELAFKKLHRVVKFNQNACLKPCIYMNIELRKNVENDFKKDFFKLMNNAVFGNTIEDVRKHRYIKLVLPGARRNYLVSETDYHTITFFSENLLAIEVKYS